MYDRLIIIGASGHGKVIADIALKTKTYKEIIFLDDNEKQKECMGFPIMGNFSYAKEYVKSASFFVAVGNSQVRERITNELLEMDAHIATLIHPSACIGECVEIGEGTAVMAGAIINPGSTVGKGNIINTASSVDHDCNLGEYVHISVGAHLCGNVTIGNSTWIGAGAVVKNGVNIIGNCMIGLGAVVVKNIDVEGTYIGVPARRND